MEKSIKQRIEEFNKGNVPFCIVSDDGRNYSLCLFLSSDSNGFYGKEAFETYAKEMGEPFKDEYGLYTHGSGYEWEAVFKKAFKNEEGLTQIVFDSEAGAFFCNCEDLSVLEDFGKRFKALCEDMDKFIPLVSAGIKEYKGMGGITM